VSVKPEEIARVVEFRNRLVAFANYVDAHRPAYGEGFKAAARQHIGTERSALRMEYGQLYKTIVRYGGVFSMTQFGGVVSQDVIRDAIGQLDHPSHTAVMDAAVSHLEEVIGRLRAEADSRSGRLEIEDFYRLTSPVFWIGRLVLLGRWLFGTTRRALASAAALAIIGAIASGTASAIVKWLLDNFASKP